MDRCSRSLLLPDSLPVVSVESVPPLSAICNRRCGMIQGMECGRRKHCVVLYCKGIAMDKCRMQSGLYCNGIRCQRHRIMVASHTETPLGVSNQRSLFAKRGKVNGWESNTTHLKPCRLGKGHTQLMSPTQGQAVIIGAIPYQPFRRTHRHGCMAGYLCPMPNGIISLQPCITNTRLDTAGLLMDETLILMQTYGDTIRGWRGFLPLVSYSSPLGGQPDSPMG